MSFLWLLLEDFWLCFFVEVSEIFLLFGKCWLFCSEFSRSLLYMAIEKIHILWYKALSKYFLYRFAILLFLLQNSFSYVLYQFLICCLTGQMKLNIIIYHQTCIYLKGLDKKVFKTTFSLEYVRKSY